MTSLWGRTVLNQETWASFGRIETLSLHSTWMLLQRNHFCRMKNVHVLLAELKSCSKTGNLERGKKLHAEVIECGYDSNIYMATALIHMYGKCSKMVDARQVFDNIKYPNVVSWNALILGYADNGQGYTALELFTRMRINGPVPVSITFVGALKACTSIAVNDDVSRCREWGKAIHELAMESGCSSDTYVQSTLVDMYAKFGSMGDAREVFNSMKHPNVVSWTALILGYAENGQGLNALELFTKMRNSGPAPNPITYVAALKACTSLGGSDCRDKGREIHKLATENGWNSDMYVQNTLIDMYSKCGSMVDASEVFDGMTHPDTVSYNALILGYADNGQGLTALKCFARMKSKGLVPNSLTFVAALKACALLGALEFGRKIHSELNCGSELNMILVTSLVDFYAKCGSLTDAQNVFDLHAAKRDVVTWNALLAGFGSCGEDEVMFGLFKKMQDAGFRPDSVTFLCVLACCSHAGLVEKGKECFDEMCPKYGVSPSVEHYNCMVDMFGRANRLDDAMALLESMPYSPNDVTWMTILGACRKWKNVEIGRVAFQYLINFNDKDASVYVLMWQIYGSRFMLQEQDMVMGMRKRIKAWNVAGESCWTNEVGEVHTFMVEDSRHPQIQEIRREWESMSVAMKQQYGYVTDIEKEELLCGHSERLALVCAFINTEAGKTIRIVKNFRVCDECHIAIAVISKMEGRTIICRDASAIHVFKGGICSCGW